ncbi:TetR/AcrR family transcriptional regulator [Mycolicibacterium sp.]|uniref:TetR/AcrR family transcriptional regulator n=1 Tax=Mycolicibacterium sp. TaxID=2320850 RepID=UPI001A1D98C4|nr:TetR/AcrR family transcriptional regulator [Mycolicibacterium sp.]MBJ7338211.1 TetR/AcrR family transcriptional regulator [Mycolicibacterium sp.]
MAGVRQFDTDRVVEKAMNLFWERGYEATSMQDLTEALGVGRGSLYAAFGSKDGLYRAALAHYLGLMASAMLHTLEGGGDVRTTVRNALLGRLTSAAEDPARRGCMLVNAVCERLPGDEHTHQTVFEVTSANRDALERALAEAVVRGEITPAFDPRSLAAFLVACLTGLLVSSKIDADLASLTRTVDIALSTLDGRSPTSASADWPR